MDSQLLQYKLMLDGIDGDKYNAMSSLYLKTKSYVRLNNFHTGWFTSKNAVRKWDTISPTLFSNFINDLAVNIKETNI